MPKKAATHKRGAEARRSFDGREKDSYRPSRFNMWVRDGSERLLVFNSFSSALLEFHGQAAKRVEGILAGRRVGHGKLGEYLASQWVLVREDCNEMDIAQRLHERSLADDHSLGLTLLPHENCNFRCTYCYEDFKKKRMSPDVVDGVIAFIRRRTPGLSAFSIGWFGGEPLLAFDIVERVTTQARDICAVERVMFSSQMTTNGYLLDSARAARCIAAGISRYQITIDGPEGTHNRMRILAGGGGTFDTILSNLRHLRDEAGGFHVAIRVNFSPENIGHMPEFIEFLGREFGRDSRFSVRFRPVGRWGGPNDTLLQVCDKPTGVNQEISLMRLAFEVGFGLQTWEGEIQPFGSVCYAASPRHFVIGSDGTVYKCTVAFDDPRNHVGRVTADGNLHLREELVTLWTRSGEETDTSCQECSFRPACQGNLCPLERLDRDEKRCPTVKTHFVNILPLLADDAKRSLPLVR